MHQPELEQAIFDYLSETGGWTTHGRVTNHVNREHANTTKRRWGSDDVMLALGELVRRRVVMFEFHTGDAMYTLRPGATL